MSEELVITYSSDIVVKVRHNQEVYVELSKQGPQGPQGEIGDVTPELEAARDDAVNSAAAALTSEQNSKASETAAKASKDSAAADVLKTAADVLTTAQNKTDAQTAKNGAELARADSRTFANQAADSASKAAGHETATALSEQNAAGSATAAAGSEDAAAASAAAALSSEQNAATSEINAKASEAASAANADAAQTSEEAAALSEANALASETAADARADDARLDADAARAERTAAEIARDVVVQAKDVTLAVRDETITAKSASEAARDASVTARTRSEAARDLAEGHAEAARGYAEQASTLDPDSYVMKAQNGADFADPAAFRANLGIQAALASVTEAEANAGSSTADRIWSPQRVRQAVAFYAPAKVHTHTVADITGLQAALNAKAALASPAFTGTPTAPTAAKKTNSTQVATTAYVDGAIADMFGGLVPETLDTIKEITDRLTADGDVVAALSEQIGTKAPLASPSLTGAPKAPTATATDNSTQIATTAHVKAAIAASGLSTEGHLHDIADVTGLQAALTARDLPDQLKAKTVILDNVVGGWNTAITPGFYTGRQLTENGPGVTGSYFGIVTVHNTTGYIRQEIWNALAGNAGFVRFCMNSVWGAWQRILETETELDARYASTNDSRIVNAMQAERVAQITDLDNTADKTFFFGFAGSAVGSPFPAGYDAVGWQVSAAGQLDQFVSTGVPSATSGLFWRIKDGGSWSDWSHIPALTTEQHNALRGLQASLDAKANAANPTLTGTVTVTHATGNAAIELGRPGGGASTPYIDFHSSTTAVDYDVRILCAAGNATAGGAILEIMASGLVGTGYANFTRFYGTNTDTAAAPSFTNASDLNTGMWFPAADQIGFSVGGVNVATVTATGITSAQDVTAYSDIRLKTNVEKITDALDMVDQLNGYRYTMNGRRSIGVIAQEVQAVAPELVREGTDEMKTLSVAYGNIVGILIEAIKELRAEVEELKRAA